VGVSAYEYRRLASCSDEEGSILVCGKF